MGTNAFARATSDVFERMAESANRKHALTSAAIRECIEVNARFAALMRALGCADPFEVVKQPAMMLGLCRACEAA